MKTTVRIRHISQLAIAALLLAAGASVRAADSGHYVGGLMDIRDYFMPDPGFYAAIYNYFYNSDRYNDQSGHRVSSISINPGPGAGVPVDVSFNLHMYALVPAFIWVSPWEILGAKYGAYAAPTFANASIDNAVYTSGGFGGSGSASTFAMGDFFAQPVWLGWTLPHWDFTAAYGFYAPVGKYGTKTLTIPGGSLTIPASDNVGLGYWTQQAQAGAAWYPWTNHATAVTVAMTYEYNSPQQGTDVHYGQNLWLNWGISQYLPLTKDQKLLLEIGPAGYYEWQISDTTGSLTESPSSRTHVGAIGGQIGLTYVPWNLVLHFHSFYEYYADTRVQGSTFGINLMKKF
jgi:hypothetical protein